MDMFCTWKLAKDLAYGFSLGCGLFSVNHIVVGCLVGIISRITELKEEIDKQLIVAKDKMCGSSAAIRI